MTRPVISLSERLSTIKPLIGCMITTRSSENAEALCLAGFEWLFLDLEHSTLDIPSAQQIIQTVCRHAYAVIRLSRNRPEYFARALDTGCDGVIVPSINSASEAHEAVERARYPPLGSRGIGLARAQGYGLRFSEYLANANSTTALILQIEHADAVQCIDEILAVPGFDAVFIGPYDLSASMGLAGQTSAPEVLQAVDTVRQACMRANIPYGMFCMTALQGRQEIDKGARLMVAGSDLVLMAGAAEAMINGLID